MKRAVYLALVSVVLLCYSLFASDYAVMIDAGSSGSRVYIYEVENAQIKFKNKLKIEPGISKFESDLPSMKPYLERLLQFAQQELPEDVKLSEVPLVLEATGGMRALSKAKQRRVMKEARKILAASGFKSPKAKIISGVTEGIYQWHSINYLRGASKPSMGLVEMGGASLQVTFKDGKKLYSRTYDGLGETLAWNRFGSQACKEIPLQYNTCRQSLMKDLSVIHQPRLRGDFYLVDYFDQLAAVLRLKSISSEMLDQKGQQVCEKTLSDLKQELPREPESYLARVCFQTAYMSVVLEKIGFDRSRELIPAREINGTSLSWTLGSLMELNASR